MTQIRIPHSISKQALKTQDVSRDISVDIDYGKIPLYFIPNEGQVNEKALYYAKASRYTLWLTNEGLVFDSSRRMGKTETGSNRKDFRDRIKREQAQHERDITTIRFLNVNKEVEMVPLDKTEHRVNYFIGNDETKWRRDIRTSRAVLYREIYQNIDLKVYGIEKEIEYDWVVRPEGNIENIRFEYEGVKRTRIDGEGNLLVETDFGEVIHRRPDGYQVIEGERKEVEASYKVIEENKNGSKVGDFREDHELVIDPIILVYSTYLGGDGHDFGNGIAVESAGNAYVTGETYSTDFPTVNPYMTDAWSRGAFVTKLFF